MNSDTSTNESTTQHDELRDWMMLNLVSGVGPRIRQALLDQFETAGQILDATPVDLRNVPGVGSVIARKIATARREIDVDQELQLCQQHGIQIISQQDKSYPRLLTEIADPPGLLYANGWLLPQDDLSIAIVGTRHASQYGLKQAEMLASGLARAGFTVISGMARGIDAAAHRAALAAGGRTIAVLGSGLLNIYPPEHDQLATEIAQQGAVITESPLHRPPRGDAFPQRNRIVTGLSLGTIVVEAALRSGALISARLSMEQGREVFAVPGRVDNRQSKGCHRLIRDGAKLVESVDDVLEELGPLVETTTDSQGKSVRHPGEMQLNDQERSVLEHIELDAVEIDLIAQKSGLPIHRVLATISVLEMKHLIRRVSGTSVARH